MFFRRACGIQIGAEFIITGGKKERESLKRVEKYNRELELVSPALPQLETARFDHACGKFDNEEGKTVIFFILIEML